MKIYISMQKKIKANRKKWHLRNKKAWIWKILFLFLQHNEKYNQSTEKKVNSQVMKSKSVDSSAHGSAITNKSQKTRRC